MNVQENVDDGCSKYKTKPFYDEDVFPLSKDRLVMQCRIMTCLTDDITRLFQVLTTLVIIHVIPKSQESRKPLA